MDRTRLPMSTVLRRYLLREFFGFLTPVFVGFVLLYLLVDLFERLDLLLKNHATLLIALRYFLFKVPLIVTQILPAAVVVALLLSLGSLSRRNEITALRASGISLVQMALPLLGATLLISITALLWNELVVPYCTRQHQYVNLVEIRKRERRSLLSGRETWYHGREGFYNIDHIDVRRQTLFGLTIYRTDSSFNLRTIVHVAAAHWTGSAWENMDAVELDMAADGGVVTTGLSPEQSAIAEQFDDFLEVQQEPEELSYRDLRRQIQDLTRKGIDASRYRVDLDMKLAVPFASFVFGCLAIPMAGKVRRHPSLAAIVGVGGLAGFAYWVVLALTNSLGQSGVMHPALAAWSANVIFLLLSFALFLRAE